MRKNYWLAVVSTILIVGSLVAGCGKSATTTTTSKGTSTVAPTATSAATPAKPKLLTFVTLDVGTKQYVASGVVAEAIKTKFGIPVRLVPVGVGANGLFVVRAANADWIYSSGDAYSAREGMDVYANRAWGPQQMRMVYQFLSAQDVSGLMVRADSNIFAPKDLKGKRIPVVPGYAAFNSLFDAVLAFAGLTWNDVTKVEVSSYAQVADALIQGKVDIHVLNTTNPSAIQAAQSPGIRWVPLDPNDAEAWKRWYVVSPQRNPGTTTQGPGVSVDKPYYGFATAQVQDAYATLKNDTAYWITKTWAESYDLYKGGQVSLTDASVDEALKAPQKGLAYAWHPGSIQYFKEVGKWTPAMEAWNNKVLTREASLLKAWEAMLAEADSKAAKEADLPALWNTYKAGVPAITQ